MGCVLIIARVRMVRHDNKHIYKENEPLYTQRNTVKITETKIDLHVMLRLPNRSHLES